jgi:hypothetical protein
LLKKTEPLLTKFLKATLFFIAYLIKKRASEISMFKCKKELFYWLIKERAFDRSMFLEFKEVLGIGSVHRSYIVIVKKQHKNLILLFFIAYLINKVKSLFPSYFKERNSFFIAYKELISLLF